jgi:acyl-CoA synthetase (AMP-forming)/AMP-acid ligase II
LPKAVGQRFEKRTGIRLFETYGMTETAAAIAFNPGRATLRQRRLPGALRANDDRVVRALNRSDAWLLGEALCVSGNWLHRLPPPASLRCA